MRGVVVLIALAGCGRLGFETQRTGLDGQRPDPDAVDLSGDAIITAPHWDRISAGDETICGISGGRAYCWGRGTNNEIGNGGAQNRPSPTEVALPAGTVTEITQGEGNACAIVNAVAYCWGSSAIGNGTPQSATPVAVTGLVNVTSISAGGQFACAVANGNAYCWGNDTNGALGNGAGGASMTPQQVTLPASAVSVDAGNDHAMVLLSDNRVFVWGHNDSMLFGSLNPASSQTAVQMPNATAVLPAVGGWHACALKAGQVTCWGEGTSGELGNNMSADSATPVVPSSIASGVNVAAAGGGPTNHDISCAAVAGLMSCWGDNTSGRIGANGTTNAAIPFVVQGIPNDVVEIAIAFETTCERSANGVVRCWGRGDLGQLGDGLGITNMSPVVVPPP